MNTVSKSRPFHPSPNDTSQLQSLFNTVSIDGLSSAHAIKQRVTACGLSLEDHRLKITRARLAAYVDESIDIDAFTGIVRDELLMVNRIFRHEMIIPDWSEFCQQVHKIYEEVEPDRSGKNADYIPILRDADPEKWGVALCTTDGQRLAIGDVDVYHSIQSASKPLNYAYALKTEGESFTLQHVGTEPSGRPFNDLTLMPDHRPFNPSVNAGAIIIAGLIASASPEHSARTLTQEIMDFWFALSGEHEEVRFSQETMVSERDTGHNNFAIAHLLSARRGLPRNVDLKKMMELYLSCCSIEMTASMLSVAAATLANGGICPTSGAQILPTEIVKKTLSVMQFSGMYDNAGSFLYEVGLPAKSGVAGAVMVIVPNLMGFATFSPRLDPYGNSMRGVSFCRKLVDRFTFHMYDSLSSGRTGCKQDPRESQHNRKQRDLSDFRWALSYGDVYATKVRDLALACMIDMCLADGDIDEREIFIIASALEDMVGSPVEISELTALANQRQLDVLATQDSPFKGLLLKLALEQLTLDDNARNIIFESAYRVACADGEVRAQEHEKLLQIADALGIYVGVVELQIDQFKRRQTPFATA